MAASDRIAPRRHHLYNPPMSAFLTLLSHLAAQVDPNLGAPGVQQGAIQRMQDPNPYDLIFPVIAFGLVIVLPVGTAIWVLLRTLRDSRKETDEI